MLEICSDLPSEASLYESLNSLFLFSVQQKAHKNAECSLSYFYSKLRDYCHILQRSLLSEAVLTQSHPQADRMHCQSE